MFAIKKLIFLPCIVLLFLATSCKYNSQMKTISEINQNWRFRQADSGDWNPATVPGTVHTDLLNNGLIADPFYGVNEKSIQWIERKDWEYKTDFLVEKEILEKDRIILKFKGLDTYADVFLNDSLLFKADNMFREWKVDCKSYLKKGENTLNIHFSSPVIKDENMAASLSYKLPDNRAFSRKAPYQYGWDWGPRFVTSGIWRPVLLKAWNTATIEQIQFIQQNVDNEVATFKAIVEVESVQKQNATITIRQNNSSHEIVKSKVKLQPGKNIIPVQFTISNPRLWWPNGLGESYLYKLETDLKVNGRLCDLDSARVGIRTVELVQEKDTAGTGFYFRVNGIPVFMKGANYIPQDNFLPRVTEEKYRRLIQDAADAHMNMLRVWGGGIYENDLFYDLCDEKGILVWQDFMFACNMYPGSLDFIENISQEAIQNVRRLRNHPCIALWCGNNEVDEGWHSWSWQKALGYTASDSTNVWDDYITIFHKILPGIVAVHDPQRSYWPSSPKIGWGHKESLTEGDCHYWGVWWGQEPFDIYKTKIGRFMSEYGFQGFPDWKTIESYSKPVDRELYSAVMLNHQKHPIGNELIETYMKREYKVPKDFRSFVYVSQLVQAYGIKIAVEAQRRAMPYCMGTLYWQLNDCWPVASWSGTDYYNRPKALHYFVKKAYAPILISSVIEDDTLKVYITSDIQVKSLGYLTLTILGFDGEILWEKDLEIELDANSSKSYFQARPDEILDPLKKSQAVLVARFNVHGIIKSENLLYFDNPMKLSLEIPEITVDTRQVENGYEINLFCDKLAKNVYLSLKDDANGSFTDNYFDLLPNEGKTVYYLTKESNLDLKGKLKITSLVDTYK
jgi:beta-mannosidase